MKEFAIFIALLLQKIPMKQLGMLMAIFVLGSLGSLYHPFWAVLLYYLLAVLRPQYLWKWALPVEWRWSLYAAIIVMISLAFHLPRVIDRVRINLISVLMVVYGVWLMLSMLTAFNPATAQSFGIDIGKILLMALIAGVVINQMWQLQGLALMLFMTLGYIAWEINSLYLTQGRLDIFHYGYGGLDNNGAGLLLAMGIPLAYAYAVGAKRLWHRLLSAGVGLLMIHSVLMTYSRGAMIAASIGVIWLLLQHRSKIQAIAIAMVLVVAISHLAGQEVRDRFVSIANYQTDASAQSRFGSWTAAWHMAWDHPITGKGIRNASHYSQNYGADRQNRVIHSQYLQIAADSGIPAMAIFIALVTLSLWYFQRGRRMCRDALDALDDGDEKASAAEQRLVLFEHTIIGCQASLFIFGVGAVFLSLEEFELPWLLMTMAGVLPTAIAAELRQRDSALYDDEHAGIRPVHQEHLARVLQAAPAVRNEGKTLARI